MFWCFSQAVLEVQSWSACSCKWWAQTFVCKHFSLYDRNKKIMTICQIESLYPGKAVIDTKHSGLSFHPGLVFPLSKQRELESTVEENKRVRWLRLNLNWTIISMWLPAGVLTNPEDAASASLSGLRYLKCVRRRSKPPSSPFVRISQFVQVRIQLGHYISEQAKLNRWLWSSISRFRLGESAQRAANKEIFRNNGEVNEIQKLQIVSMPIVMSFTPWICHINPTVIAHEIEPLIAFLCLMFSWKVISRECMEREIKYICYMFRTWHIQKQRKLLIKHSEVLTYSENSLFMPLRWR